MKTHPDLRLITKSTCLLIALTLVFLSFFLYYSPPAEASTLQTIVINPGHQEGSDTGAVNSTTGITEVELNNTLAIKVVQSLRDAGYNAMLSHEIPENTDLPTLLDTTVNSSTDVCNAANELGADLLVSIHHNSGGSSASGYEFYWSSYHPTVDNDGLYQKANAWSDGSSATLDSTPPEIALESEELANLFNTNFEANLTYLPSRNKIVERDDSIVKKTSMPSVLIEAGFVSNNSESLLLADNTNQQAMADQIVASINTFFGNDTPTITASSIKASLSDDTQIDLSVSGIETTNSVKSITFAVWSENSGQDDLKWYTATKQSDGSYTTSVDIEDHKKDDGTYQIHCYGIDENGKSNFLGSTTASISIEKMTASTIEATLTSESEFEVTIFGIDSPDGIKSISVPVWSELDGQDDLVWYTATKQSDGSYQATIDIGDHRYDGGTYYIHCYGVDNYNKSIFLGSTSISMTVSTMSADKISAASSSEGKITITASSISAPYGLTEVLFPVWSDSNGQDDIKWYTATKQSNGTYQASVPVSDHSYESGTYNIHCYGRDSYNKLTYLGNTTTTMELAAMSANTVSATVSGRQITSTVSGIDAPGGIENIYFAAWTATDGQDDIVWYEGDEQSDGSYQVTINSSEHNYETGTYDIHCYGVDINSQSYQYLGYTTAKITYTPTTAEEVAVSVNENVATATVSGLDTTNGIKEIQIAAWCETDGQDDIVWYTATKQSDGSYKAIIDAKNHDGTSGVYDFHAYCIENDGTYVFLGSTSASIRYVETPIMGETTVTAAELVAYYKSTGETYPQSYNDIGVNLETFVDLYISEAEAEGVRAEVAFAQAMLETGNLQFGGDVDVSQFNFAGLGATGNGVAGFNFAETYGNDEIGLQTGIRAHIQHLKCYASNEDLNNETVDPRWNDKLRTKALSVEELAGTWAADLTYAPKIKAIMNKF